MHYVPVAEDFSDLEERLSWLRANDEEAHRIARRAADLFDSQFKSQNLFCYMRSLFARLVEASLLNPNAGDDLVWEPARVGSKLGREPLPSSKDLV